MAKRFPAWSNDEVIMVSYRGVYVNIKYILALEIGLVRSFVGSRPGWQKNFKKWSHHLKTAKTTILK